MFIFGGFRCIPHPLLVWLISLPVNTLGYTQVSLFIPNSQRNYFVSHNGTVQYTHSVIRKRVKGDHVPFLNRNPHTKCMGDGSHTKSINHTNCVGFGRFLRKYHTKCMGVIQNVWSSLKTHDIFYMRAWLRGGHSCPVSYSRRFLWLRSWGLIFLGTFGRRKMDMECADVGRVIALVHM